MMEEPYEELTKSHRAGRRKLPYEARVVEVRAVDLAGTMFNLRVKIVEGPIHLKGKEWWAMLPRELVDKIKGQGH